MVNLGINGDKWGYLGTIGLLIGVSLGINGDNRVVIVLDSELEGRVLFEVGFNQLRLG